MFSKTSFVSTRLAKFGQFETTPVLLFNDKVEEVRIPISKGGQLNKIVKREAQSRVVISLLFLHKELALHNFATYVRLKIYFTHYLLSVIVGSFFERFEYLTDCKWLFLSLNCFHCFFSSQI